MKDAKLIDVSGVRTRYCEAGDGEPMLLLHGGDYSFTSNATDWGPAYDSMARNFHVYALDRLGQGFTDLPKRDSDYVIGATVPHSYEFLKRLGIDRSHVVGHSRGGYAACRLALEYPEVINTLTIVDSGTLITPRESPNDWYAKVEEEAMRLPDPREQQRYMSAANSFGSGHITDEWLDDLIKVADSPKIKEVRGKWAQLRPQFLEDLEVRSKETRDWIAGGRLKTPTLVTWGFDDPSAKMDPTGISALNLILPNVRQSQMHIFSQAGHYVFREHPDAFAAVMKAFVDST